MNKSKNCSCFLLLKLFKLLPSCYNVIFDFKEVYFTNIPRLMSTETIVCNSDSLAEEEWNKGLKPKNIVSDIK